MFSFCDPWSVYFFTTPRPTQHAVHSYCSSSAYALVRLCNLVRLCMVGYSARKTWLHSLSGLENLLIHKVSKSPVRDLWGGF